MTDRSNPVPPQDDPVSRLAAANPVTTPPEDLGPVWERIEPRLSDFDVEVEAVRTDRPTIPWRRRSLQVAAATTAALLLGGSGFAVGWTSAAPASPEPTPTPTASPSSSPTPRPSPSATATPPDVPLSRLEQRKPLGDGLDIDASALPDQATTAPVWQLADIDPQDPHFDAMAAALGLAAQPISDNSEYRNRVWGAPALSASGSAILTVSTPWDAPQPVEVSYTNPKVGSECHTAADEDAAKACWKAYPAALPAAESIAVVTDLLTQAGFDPSTLTVARREPNPTFDGGEQWASYAEVNVSVNDGLTPTGGPAMTFTFLGDDLYQFKGWPTLPTALGEYPVISPQAAAARLADITLAPLGWYGGPVGTVTATQAEPTSTDRPTSTSLPVPWEILPVRLVSAYLTTDTYIGVGGARFLLPTWVLVDDTGVAWRALALDTSALAITDMDKVNPE